MNPPASPTIDALRERLPALTVRDREKLMRRLAGVGRNPPPSAIDRLASDIEAAEKRIGRRRAVVPTVSYPADLPIVGKREELLKTIAEHQVVIVAGETGSGKSTQLPKLCLELGRGVAGMIGHTQPRRLAARTIAERVSEELGSSVGATVGYTVRFTDRVAEQTLIKVMTDGILLAETQRDRQLFAYDTLIIDEAHERSLNIDFLLGYIHQLLPRRPDLKVIITSATIDTERFSAHFGGAPVVEVSGRGYPVDLRYRPYGDTAEDDRDQTQAICDAVAELQGDGNGDVLVFLNGEREIHDTADALRRLQLPQTEILPLYARLSGADQHRIFRTHTGRRIVLSTNVAETSLTVPGIRYVVDAGTARISRFSRRLKVQRLPIEAISQASANQRAGRCGRVAPGICIRLYSEEDFTSRPAFTEPEILRTNLASVILQMAVLDLGEVAAFPFVDPPDHRSIKDGVALLEELGAFDSGKCLTAVGRKLAQLPVDPRIGRMVLEAERYGCVREVMVIASALSIQDPRERPSDKTQAADEKHARFRAEGSDFIGVLNLWTYLREQQRLLSSSQFRKLCRSEYLNYLRVREWQDINSQLRQTAASIGLKVNASISSRRDPDDAGADVPALLPDHLHQALLAGLLTHIGLRDGESREFRGVRNARFSIGAGSALARKPPQWIMAAELVETNRLWARTCGRVQPEWIERIGAHLCVVTHSEPRWQPERGAVVATERVTMLGLPIVTGRTVDYARIDPHLARELFIRHALVDGDWATHHTFLAENRQRIAEVRKLEDRARRRDILLDDDGIEALYATRIPDEVTSARRFDQWWKKTRYSQPDLLTFDHEELLDRRAGDLRLADYPDVWCQGDRTYRLSYVFDPTSPDDGVTVHLPLLELNQIGPAGFEWLVAGHRLELVEEMIRTLPKALRRHVIPIGDRARSFVASWKPSDGPLIDLLAEELSAVARIEAAVILPSDLGPERLAPHLRMTFSVEDGDGRCVAKGKDLAELKARLAPRVRAAIADAMPVVERQGLIDWTFDAIPQSVTAGSVRGFPSLVDDKTSVALRVLTTAAEQRRAMRAGTRRLLALSIAVPRKALERCLSNDTKLALARFGATLSVASLVDDAVLGAIDTLMTDAGGPVWDADAFVALRTQVRLDLHARAEALLRLGGQAVVVAGRIEARLDTSSIPALRPSVDDVARQLRWLVHPGFITATGAARLGDVLRYLTGIERRLDKLAAEPARDQQRVRVLDALERDIETLMLELPTARRGEAVSLRWMLEELRVSLFAQSLGTAYPISEQRVRKEIERVAAGEPR